MQIALYKGTSLVSRLIRFVTRSEYSHAAFRFDEHAADIAEEMRRTAAFKKLHFFHQGAVVEAWEGGVKNSLSLSSLHTPGTVVDLFDLKEPLGELDERVLIALLDQQVGDPYSYWNVLRFLTRVPGSEDGSWFCSEMCFHDLAVAGRVLWERTEAWRVPPDWLPRSPLVRFARSVMTR